jgi:DNA repair exonuclease SbcCD ATPase subunit
MDAELNRGKAGPSDPTRSDAKAEDDLLGVIADVERQLASLKAVRVEREDQRHRLDVRETELVERETQLKQMTDRLHQAEREQDARRQEIDEREAALKGQRDKAERDLKALGEEQQKAASIARKRNEELDARSQTLDGREQRLAENAAGLSRQRESLESRTAALGEQEKNLRAREAEAERQRKACDEMKAKSEADQKTAQAAAATAEKAGAELAGAKREADKARSELAGAQKEAERSRSELGAAQKGWEKASGELAGIRKDAEKARSEAESAQRRIAELEKAVEASRADLKRSGEAQGTLMKELAEKTKAADRAASGAEEARSQVADFKRQVIERDEKVQDLSKKLVAATDKFREVSRSIQEQADLVGQAQSLDQDLRTKSKALTEATEQLKARDQRIAALETQASQASQGKKNGPQDPALRERADALARELEAAKASIRERDEQIVDLRSAAESPSAAGGDDDRREALEDGLREAHARLTEMLAENKRLRAAAESGDGGGEGGIPPEVGEIITRRWERLRVLRRLVREQSDKIRQAGEAVRGRYEQAEQVLAQRDDLATARKSMAETKRKLESLQVRSAKHRAISSMFYALLTLAGVGALSWVLAGQIAPATFVARAAISADTAGEKVAPDVLAEWQRFHESLLADPQMVEIAAERMGRKGLSSLSVPGALAERLKNDLTHESGAPGKLVLELRGQGAAKTTRELDTYVTALVSQANSVKERRVDGLSTAVTSGASAGPGPVEDARPVYALAIFALGFGLVVSGGIFFWRRLLASKMKFEEAEMADSALESQVWNKPPEVFSKV